LLQPPRVPTLASEELISYLRVHLKRPPWRLVRGCAKARTNGRERCFRDLQLLSGREFAGSGASCQAKPNFNVYFGNLHSHTSYSDGSGTPDDAYRHAQTAGLDFLAITEHNHKSAESGAQDRRDGLLIATDPSLYAGSDRSLLTAAARWSSDGRFIALYGQEFSSISSGNHVNVFDVPKVIQAGNGQFDELLNWLADPAHHDSTGRSAVLQLNHPRLYRGKAAYGRDDFGGDAQWIATMGAAACLLELLNGPAMARQGGERPAETAFREYQYYLSLGFRVAPTGNQDNHYFTWGTTTDARTGLLARALTRDALLEAMRERRAYASEDRNLRILFTLNGHLMGAETPALAAASALEVKAWIEDDDEPHATYTIDVFQGTIGTSTPVELTFSDVAADSPGPTTITGLHAMGGSEFLFLRITQFDEDGGRDVAWTAPVWLREAQIPVAPTGASDVAGEVAECVASRRSRIYHLSPDCADARRIAPGNLLRGHEAVDGREPHVNCPRQ